jgi:hypothetical protein
MHALEGNALALFLMSALIDALKELVENDTIDPETLLAQLKSEEDQLYASFATADLPKTAYQLYALADEKKDPDVDVDLLFKGPSICRTGRVPAQSRYLGYVTNTNHVGSFAPVGKETYDLGISLKEADSTDAGGVMRLVYNVNDNDHEVGCPVVVKPDYKDVFYAPQKDGLVKLTIPNEAERKAYRFDQSEYKGLIGIFLGGCSWGKCKEGEMEMKHFDEGLWEVTVNGKPVKSLVEFSFSCIFLKGDDGIYWKPSAKGDYEIGFEVKTPGGFLRLSSVVIY